MAKFKLFSLGIIIGLTFWNFGSKKVLAKPNPNPDPQTVYVFIHGIKGSRLVNNDSGKTFWVTGLQGTGLQNREISLPLKWQDDSQVKDNLYASEPLDKVTLIPGIIENKIYQDFLKIGQQAKNFYPFAYDWRRSNNETRSKFLSFCGKLVEKHQKPLTVIAHSMGGLITMSALQEEPDLFKKIYFAGVPFAGGIGFLEDLHKGIPTGLNKKIAGPEVLATMPSVYTLFPLQAGNRLIENQEALPVDFFNPQDWEKYQLGPFAHNISNKSGFKQWFNLALADAKKFRESLFGGSLLKAGKLLQSQPKIHVIFSRKHPTPFQFVKSGPQSVLGIDFVSGKKLPGDGRVAAEHALPPKGLSYQKFVSEATHEQLLNDPQVLEYIFNE